MGTKKEIGAARELDSGGKLGTSQKMSNSCEKSLQFRVKVEDSVFQDA
jgi:hypothetical protein